MSAATAAAARFATSTDPETTFCWQLADMITRTRPKPIEGDRDWRAQPFSPLLLGYNGKGNVGADLRVREMLRQMRVLFGHAGFDPLLTVMGTVPLDPLLDQFRQVRLDGYLPDVLQDLLEGSDGVIACEGSMFTSTFSDMLSASFAGAIGIAAAQGRLAVGYGAESGRMSSRLERFVQRACRRGMILSRSARTHAQMKALGLNSAIGADTAWTYVPGKTARERVRAALLAQGWRPDQRLAVICPMNPFCWPIVVDFERAAELSRDGRHRDQHYDGVLFHAAPAGAEEAFAHYLQEMDAVVQGLRQRGYFPVLVGMEKLDARAVDRLNARLQAPLPTFVSGRQDAETIVSVLHQAHQVVTSRFHACVLSLNAGVRTVGIALDERIRNLYHENGMADWFVRCDDACLSARILAAVDDQQASAVQGCLDRLLAGQLRLMGEMGWQLHDLVCQAMPGFPPSSLPRDWRYALPPLEADMAARLERALTADPQQQAAAR